MAYNNIGYAYSNGKGVERDEKKARYYWELGAIKGNVKARFNLGKHEAKAGNFDRVLKHYMIAAASGHPDSLTYIKQMYSNQLVTKDVYWKHYNPIKHIWVRLKVNRGMKPLLPMKGIVIISVGFPIRWATGTFTRRKTQFWILYRRQDEYSGIIIILVIHTISYSPSIYINTFQFSISTVAEIDPSEVSSTFSVTSSSKPTKVIR